MWVVEQQQQQQPQTVDFNTDMKVDAIKVKQQAVKQVKDCLFLFLCVLFFLWTIPLFLWLKFLIFFCWKDVVGLVIFFACLLDSGRSQMSFYWTQMWGGVRVLLQVLMQQQMKQRHLQQQLQQQQVLKVGSPQLVSSPQIMQAPSPQQQLSPQPDQSFAALPVVTKVGVPIPTQFVNM